LKARARTPRGAIPAGGKAKPKQDFVKIATRIVNFIFEIIGLIDGPLHVSLWIVSCDVV